MLRLAERHKVNRKDFLDRYVGHEMDDTWLQVQGKADKKWSAFVTNEAESIERIRTEVSEISQQTGMALVEFRRIVNLVQKGEREARHRQEGDGRGEPAPGDLHRQEIHQSRPAVPGSDPGGQYRPDEGGG